VHDGIHLEKAGIPTATICTSEFVSTAEAMRQVWGAADYPVLFMQHPLSSLSEEELRERAHELAEQVAQVLAPGGH
jgi:hypothetical protein